MWWFKREKKQKEEEYISVWKADFSDCITADYLPNFSMCQTPDNSSCRFVAHYSGMILCSHPEHKSFIPEGDAPFDPLEGRFTN